MNRLREINDEIYRRWKAGESHMDLADEFKRWPGSLRTLLRNRHYGEGLSPRGGPEPTAHMRDYWKARNLYVVEHRDAGWTYLQIAEAFGVCPERVAQIVRRERRKRK